MKHQKIIVAIFSGILCASPLIAHNQGDFVISLASSINVKNYPSQVQDLYTLFEAKCTTCHGLKETLRSPGVIPSYWEQTVERMKQMPKSDISSDDAHKITEFLIYNSFFSRRVELKNQLKALTPEQLKVEQDKLDQILNKYKN
jgi:hypothetical protein